MERAWLEEQLAAGRSIQGIAEAADKGASTVAYWINKHGLVAAHARRHAAKGPVDEAVLRELVERGASTREIAAELGRSQYSVRYWLHKHGLRTEPSRYRRGDDKPSAVLRHCRVHGWTSFQLVGGQRYLCGACNVERVVDRRRRIKGILLTEAGGRCVVCGYDRYAGALQFHHVDPATKRFDIGGRGLTRNLDVLREEASRCALLCGNCHAEVEAGVTQLPSALPGPKGPLGGSSMAEQSAVNR